LSSPRRAPSAPAVDATREALSPQPVGAFSGGAGAVTGILLGRRSAPGRIDSADLVLPNADLLPRTDKR